MEAEIENVLGLAPKNVVQIDTSAVATAAFKLHHSRRCRLARGQLLGWIRIHSGLLKEAS